MKVEVIMNLMRNLQVMVNMVVKIMMTNLMILIFMKLMRKQIVILVLV